MRRHQRASIAAALNSVKAGGAYAVLLAMYAALLFQD
jgi:hypothetical protein